MWGSDPMDPTVETTMSTEFTAWVGWYVADFRLCKRLKGGPVGALHT